MEQNFLIPFAKRKRQKRANSVTFRPEYYTVKGHVVAHLVEALRYKPEGRGFDSQLCHWNFSLI